MHTAASPLELKLGGERTGAERLPRRSYTTATVFWFCVLCHVPLSPEELVRHRCSPEHIRNAGEAA